MTDLRGACARHAVMLVLTALVLAGACTSTDGDADAGPTHRLEQWVGNARFPVAPVPLPDGGLLYGERLTGRIRHVDPHGKLATPALARLPVLGSIGDQRGLLGLARTGDGRLFASWTGADGRLVVGAVTAGGSPSPRIVWSGPRSADRANGGTLAIDNNQRLLIGVGDLLADRRLGRDPTVPNRKILALDPDGPPTQVPIVISTGWNNPYALVVTSSGEPWAADNAGGRSPERIGRADRPAAAATELRADHTTVAPAAVVDLGHRRLGVCGYVSGRLDEYRVRHDRAVRTGRVIATPCRLGGAVLHDGRLVTLTPHAVYRGPRPMFPPG